MDELPINSLDLAVGIVLLVSALLAFMRGFVHEVLSIAAWVGAVLAAVFLLPLAQPFARGLIPLVWAADAAAAVVIFLAVLFGLSIATHAMSKTIQKSAFNNLDRTLGFVFGLARALVILGVGLIITDWLTDKDRPQWMIKAKTLPVVEMAADTMKALLPDSFMAAKDAAKDGAATIERAMDAKKALDGLMPAAGDAKASEGGYGEKERRDMERLLQTNEGRPSDAPPAAPEGGQ